MKGSIFTLITATIGTGKIGNRSCSNVPFRNFADSKFVIEIWYSLGTPSDGILWMAGFLLSNASGKRPNLERK